MGDQSMALLQPLWKTSVRRFLRRSSQPAIPRLPGGWDVGGWEQSRWAGHPTCNALQCTLHAHAYASESLALLRGRH